MGSEAKAHQSTGDSHARDGVRFCAHPFRNSAEIIAILALQIVSEEEQIIDTATTEVCRVKQCLIRMSEYMAGMILFIIIHIIVGAIC